MAELIGRELKARLDALKGPAFEDSMPYMYVDTTGHITVGRGHNISAHGDLLRLPFIVQRFEREHVKGGDRGIPIGKDKVVGRAATDDEKKKDFNFLNKHRGLGRYEPRNLAKYTTLELEEEDIEKLFDADLEGAVKSARREFDNFDTFSVDRQAALVDLAFNGGGFGKFPKLVSAIKGQGEYKAKTEAARWQEAAKNSSRSWVSPTRNAKVAEWLK